VTIVQAIILGIVQGLTEFIPISSSAHLIIVPWLFQWTDPALGSLSFDVALHLGTLVAVLRFFAADWVRLIRAGVVSLIERKIGNDVDRRLAWLIVIGCIPGGIVGALAESKIEELFHKPNAPIEPSAMIGMGIIIALLGAALFAAERIARHVRQMNQLSLTDSILIGLAQSLAIFPGVSRSGSTITAGLALGLERAAAARFSFLLSAPIIAGAGAKSLLKIFSEWKSGALTPFELSLFPIGFAAAAISGYLCIKFLLRFLQRNSTDIFVYYRWALAILITVAALVRG
jgi:undecaprenyl-diphosphatase